MVAKIKDKNLYYVGGVVRDEILNIPNFDTDFCYEGNAIEFSKNYNVIKTNPDFGTVRIFFENREIDIASTRKETYPKVGHLPLVTDIGCPLKDDLSRRDFTINAMAKNTITGEVIDFFNGLEDIKNKKIKVLHDKSFIEDPSRILRALKFSVRFDFELDKETENLQNKYLDNINYDMSFHRIKKEIKETFNLNSDMAYNRFINQNIYKLLGQNQIIPNLTTSIQDLVEQYQPDTVWIVYAGLFNLSNFELTAEEKNIIDSYKKIQELKPKTDLEIYNMFKALPLESILLYSLTESFEIGKKYLDILSKISISINGDDLKKLGFNQGKVFKEIFNFVLEKKFISPEADKEQEIEWVKERFL